MNRVNPNGNAVDGMVWSYSRLSSYEQCKYQFYLKYLIADDDTYMSEGNFYAELGSYCHDILRMVLTDELDESDAGEYFVSHYDENVFYHTSRQAELNAQSDCAQYFADLDLSPLKDYDIIGVEKPVRTEIGGFPFYGIIDLLLRRKDNGDMVLLDHKSGKSPFSAKTGKPLKSAEKTLVSYKRQLYLYAHAVKNEYGVFPKSLKWNHFRENCVVTVSFDEKEYRETLLWFESAIDDIRKEEDYEGRFDYFYCRNLCEFRASCEYAQYQSTEGDEDHK